MAGTSPAMTRWEAFAVKMGTAYILTNRPNGTLYLGITSDLGRRAWQRRTGALPGFTKRYGPTRLVWYEHHELVTAGIQREHTMKHRPRAWKVRLILDLNPTWRDLYEELSW